MNVTLAILKPDIQKVPFYRKLIETLINDQGLRIIANTSVRFDRRTAEEFYSEHRGKFFYPRLVNHMLSGPLGAYILQGPDAVTVWRKMIGPTKVYKAVYENPDTLRGKYGLTDTRNGFHGSDSFETFCREVKFFFPEFDVSTLSA